jgi:hypothetical protein
MKTETFFRNLKRETNKKHWKIKIIPSGPRDPLYFNILRTYRNTEPKFLFWKKWKTYRTSMNINYEAILALKNSSGIIPIIIKQLKGRSNGN